MAESKISRSGFGGSFRWPGRRKPTVEIVSLTNISNNFKAKVQQDVDRNLWAKLFKL